MRLKEYINTLGISPKIFAKKAGLSHITIRNLMALSQDVYLSTALKIEKETCGAVKCKDLLPEKYEI